MKTVFDIPNYPLLNTKEDPLKLILSWRRELLDAYIDAGRLPNYPLNGLSNRVNQNFVRDLIGYCEEEIFEAYDELNEIAISLEMGINPTTYIETLKKVQAYNEELADVMHFILEILVYLNIEYDDIDAYYGKLLKEKGLESIYFSKSLLTNAMSYANYANIHEGYKVQAIRMSNYTLLKDDEVQNDFEQAGRSISITNLTEYRELLFGMMKYLNKIRCLMKNKYWKEDTESAPNMELIHLYAMEAFLHFMSYLDLTGATEKSIIQTYYKKHKINLDRLQNGW